jgi:tight adherence protein C
MLKALIDPANIIVFLATLAALGTVLALAMPFLQRDTLSGRLQSVAKRREELSAQQKARLSDQKRPRLRRSAKAYQQQLVDRLKLLDPTQSDALRQKLSSAGYRGQGPLITFTFFRFVMPLVLALVTAIYVFLMLKSGMKVPMKLAIVVGMAGVGYLLPGILLANKIQTRQAALTKSFPDTLDLMVICVEAGLSMEAAFNRVAKEIADSAPELSEELLLTTAELAFLPDRRTGLENFAIRTGLPQVKALTTALIQSEKYGTPLSVALRVLARENRDARMSRAEKKAAALPAQLTVPMIAFFLPVIFVVLLGPAVLKTLAVVASR